MGIDRYSINFKQKDGSYVGYTFSRIDPMSAVLSMAADYAYYAQNSDSANLVDLENVFKAGTLAAAQYATNMPFLQGTLWKICRKKSWRCCIYSNGHG